MVSDGKAGHVNQCLGLAEALGVEEGLASVEVRTVVARAPWRWLPARAWLAAGAAPQTPLTPPWPDLVITAGRTAVAVGAWLRRQGVPTVTIQDPRLPLRWFDATIAPAHDGIRGESVITTLGALTRITPARLDAAASAWRDRLAPLGRPLVAVLLGGANRVFRFDAATSESVGAALRHLQQDGMALAITASRRTPAEAVQTIQAALAPERLWWWDGTGDNPYFGLLALADHLVVTMDSVSMLSEAASTGRPVHGIALPGAAGKFAHLHQRLIDYGALRPLSLPLAEWSYPPLAETAAAARAVRQRLGWL